jgi:hypothetical protein
VYRLLWSLSISLAPIVWLAAICTEYASAQQPNLLQKFRFIPSRSTLDVTGGVADIRQKFFTYGKFGLNAGNDRGPHAEFVGVDSWLVPDSPLTFVWHTDRTLNLSGLAGTFAPSDSSQITFQGVDGQGAPFNLTAVQRGRLVHLVGENDPPCCDFFKYKFDAMAHIAPYADFNLDGMVDQLDAEILSANIGTYSHATLEQGDTDGDADVDGDDFLTWQRELGSATPMSAFANASSAGSSVNSNAVPEPTTLVLLSAAASALTCNRRRRKITACRPLGRKLNIISK